MGGDIPKVLDKARIKFVFSSGEVKYSPWYYEDKSGGRYYWVRLLTGMYEGVITSNQRLNNGAFSKVEVEQYVKYSWWEKLLIAAFPKSRLTNDP